MSRSAEETQQLEERIRRMKLNSERLQRRHLEVEQDKLCAAQQNALVQIAPPSNVDWVIRPREPDFDYVDNRSPPQPPSEGSFGRGRGRGRGWGSEPRKSWSNEHDDRTEDEPNPRRTAPGRGRGEPHNQGPGRGRRSFGASPPSPFAENSPGGNRDEAANADFRRTPWRSPGGQQNVIPSKVFSNTSSYDGTPHKPRYRLPEGDGPPPDPSFSFHMDSMRDGNKHNDRRKEDGRGSHNFIRGKDANRLSTSRPERGPAPGRSHTNQSTRPPRSQQSYEDWRRERDAIDQKRIDRQKRSDGNWSREWDSDKVVQNESSPPRHPDNYEQGRPRYKNRFGDFVDDNFYKRTRTRSNPMNESGPSDAKPSLETDAVNEGGQHERGNFRRQPRRQFSNENYSDRHFHNTPSPREPQDGAKAPKSFAASRLEAARTRSGPVRSNLRQFDTDVCTVTMPSTHPDKVPLSSPEVPSLGGPRDVDSPATKTKIGDQPSASPHPTLKVCVRMDESGKRTMIVEGVGCAGLPAELGLRDSKKVAELLGVPQKRRRRVLKTRKQRTPHLLKRQDEDDSWEDVSSEEDVSFVADLPGPSQLAPQPSTAKTIDVSSGPESLDPIPAPNKEEELLWEEFHPAGFQNNMTLAMVTETAYKALLSKGEESAVEGACEEGKPESGTEPVPSVQFSVGGEEVQGVVDKSEEAGSIVDPMLVVTQLVKAEVDCMSLTSLTTDCSLPEDINLTLKNELKPTLPERSLSVDAEELSGPVSILQIGTRNEADSSSNSDGSFQSTNGLDFQVTGDEDARKRDEHCDVLKDSCSNKTAPELELSNISPDQEECDVNNVNLGKQVEEGLDYCEQPESVAEDSIKEPHNAEAEVGHSFNEKEDVEQTHEEKVEQTHKEEEVEQTHNEEVEQTHNEEVEQTHKEEEVEQTHKEEEVEETHKEEEEVEQTHKEEEEVEQTHKEEEVEQTHKEEEEVEETHKEEVEQTHTEEVEHSDEKEQYAVQESLKREALSYEDATKQNEETVNGECSHKDAEIGIENEGQTTAEHNEIKQKQSVIKDVISKSDKEGKGEETVIAANVEVCEKGENQGASESTESVANDDCSLSSKIDNDTKTSADESSTVKS